MDTLKRFLWIAFTVTALRIIYLVINHRNLDVEEAQYWTWSQHLALGYHSKPPMISWAIYASTWIFGNSEWAIRLFSPITYLLSAMLLYGCGKNLYHPTIGFWSGLTVLLLPGVTYSATIMSTDPLLVLFWCLALYAFINGSKTHKIKWWVLCGAAIGLGLLSKYTMLIFFLSAVLYFICSVENRSLWKKPGPYIALLIALITFLPNAIWNTQHHNAALHHVIEHNIDIEGVHFHLKNLGVFLLSQAGILGPIIFSFLIIALFRSKKMTQLENSRLLICFTAPILLLMSSEALLSHAYANWAAVAYPSGTILAVAYMWEQNFRRWLKLSVWLHVFAAILLCGWELAVAYDYCRWPQSDRPNWHQFGNAVQRYDTLASDDAIYLVDDRELWAKMIYYGGIPRDRLFVWDPKQTVDWLDNPAHLTMQRGGNFIFITYQATLPNSLFRSFKQSQRLADFSVHQRLWGRRRHIYIYRLEIFLEKYGASNE